MTFLDELQTSQVVFQALEPHTREQRDRILRNVLEALARQQAKPRPLDIKTPGWPQRVCYISPDVEDAKTRACEELLDRMVTNTTRPAL